MSRPSNSPPSAARASLPYRLALGLVAVVMAVLPCVYVALTALAAWGTYLFATRYFVAIWQWPTGYNRGALIIKIICSCTPVLTGGTAAFFMVKPLFARRTARTQPLTLTAQDLFDSFDGLSRLVTLAHYQDNLNVPIAPDFLIPLEQLLRAEMDKTAAAAPNVPAATPARTKVPMMAYDPSGFQGKARP